MKGFASWLLVIAAASVAVGSLSAATGGTARSAQDGKAPKQDGEKKDGEKKEGEKKEGDGKKEDGKKEGKKVVAGEWGTNYDAALAAAKKDKKLILADFTGSDWCGWCIKLKDEVFSKPEFIEWAKKNVILLEVDFPQKKKLPDDLKKQNDELMKKNKKDIPGYPTILFFNAKGEVVGQMGYQEGGPAKWTKDADKFVEKAKR